MVRNWHIKGMRSPNGAEVSQPYFNKYTKMTSQLKNHHRPTMDICVSSLWLMSTTVLSSPTQTILRAAPSSQQAANLAAGKRLFFISLAYL